MSAPLIYLLTLLASVQYALCDSATASRVIDDDVPPADYPYSKPKPYEGGISLGPGMSLAFPSWLLSLIFVAFACCVGYVVKLIFDGEKAKETAKLDKQKRRDEKQLKKAGKSSSRKAE